MSQALMLSPLNADEMSACRGMKRAVAGGLAFVGPSKFSKGPTFVRPRKR